MPSDRDSSDSIRHSDDRYSSVDGPAAGTPRPVLQRSGLWLVLQMMFRIFCRSWLRLKVSGHEHLDAARGGLLLINHQSFLDPLLVAVLLDRPVSYLARDTLFRVPVLGWILRRTYVIPISREAVRGGSIKAAIERLEQGVLVGIFPEGRRASEPGVSAFRPGFLAIVRRTTQPVYPVAVSGAAQAMPRGAWFIRPCPIRVVFGPPLSDEERDRFQHESDDAALAEIARQKVADCLQTAEQMRQHNAEPSRLTPPQPPGGRLLPPPGGEGTSICVDNERK